MSSFLLYCGFVALLSLRDGSRYFLAHLAFLAPGGWLAHVCFFVAWFLRSLCLLVFMVFGVRLFRLVLCSSVLSLECFCFVSPFCIRLRTSFSMLCVVWLFLFSLFLCAFVWCFVLWLCWLCRLVLSWALFCVLLCFVLAVFSCFFWLFAFVFLFCFCCLFL